MELSLDLLHEARHVAPGCAGWLIARGKIRNVLLGTCHKQFELCADLGNRTQGRPDESAAGTAPARPLCPAPLLTRRGAAPAPVPSRHSWPLLQLLGVRLNANAPSGGRGVEGRRTYAGSARYRRPEWRRPREHLQAAEGTGERVGQMGRVGIARGDGGHKGRTRGRFGRRTTQGADACTERGHELRVGSSMGGVEAGDRPPADKSQ